jgi:hypothetical protein
VAHSQIRFIAFFTFAASVATGLVMPAGARAQAKAGSNPQSTAPVDLTGYWVSVVTEDWRYRMVTPAKGDYASVPLNPQGKQIADAWDPAKDEAAGEQCKAFGAPAIMRVPGRFHISWENESTLRLETDTGTQTRIFEFSESKTAGTPRWQGYSRAVWEFSGQGPAAQGAGPQNPRDTRGGSLKVLTSGLRAGYLRRNGVPYSANATLTEYYSRVNEPDGTSWLVVTTLVEDPKYLNQPFLTSAHFKRQPDAIGWTPSPCKAR